MTDRPFVRLYGGPLIVVGEGRPALTPAQRRLLAIVYLDAPDPVSREEVSWLLWEVGETAETRHRIRQLVYGINRDAPCPVIEREGDLLVPCLRTDCDQAPPSLSPPLRLVTPCGTTAFEHWLDTARDRLGRRRVNRLAAALDSSKRRLDWPNAFDLASNLVELDEDAERWVTVLTEVAVRAGMVSQARATVERSLREVSQGERSRILALLSAIPSELQAPEETSSQLLGRTEELEWLKRRAARPVGVHFAFLRGASGVGKTRLLEEVGRWAAAASLPVGFARLKQSLASVPLSAAAAIVEVLQRSTRLATGGSWPNGDPTHRSIDRQARGASRPSMSRELVAAFQAEVDRATRSQPLLLLVDDAQWVDPTSLQLLQSIGSDGTRHGLSLILSVRVEQRRGLPPRLATCAREVRADELLVPELDEATSAELVAQQVNPAPPEGKFKALYRLAGGNPMGLIDLGRGWAQRGWSDSEIPGSLLSRVGRVTERLSPEEALVLAVISAMDTVTSAQLQGLLNKPAWDIAAILDTLVSVGLTEQVEAEYRFRHAMLRDAAVQHLGPTLRAEGHLNVARWLQDSDQLEPARVVYHYRQAGAKEAASRWALAAARDARAKGAIIEASEFYGWALEGDSFADDPGLVAEAGRLAISACQLERGSQLLARAATLSSTPDEMWDVERLDAESEIGTTPHLDAATAIQSIAMRSIERSQWAAGLSALETSIRVMERGGHWRAIQGAIDVAGSVHPTNPEAAVLRGMILALGSVYGSMERASREARSAYRLAASLPETSQLVARAAHRLFVVLLSEGTVMSDLGLECLRVLGDEGRLTRNLKLQYTALANEAVWHLETGNLDRAAHLLDCADEVISGSDAVNERQNLATNRGDLLLRSGQPELAMEYFLQARDLITPGTRGFLRDVVAAGIGLCHIGMGRLRNAELSLEEVRRYDHYYFDPSLLLRLGAEVRWRRGQRDEAVLNLAVSRLSIEKSFVPQYLSLTLLEARLRKRMGNKAASARLASEVAGIASELGLSHLAEQARGVEGSASQS